MKHDTTKIALIVLLVVASAGVGYAATTTFFVSEDVSFDAHDGPEVTVGEELEPEVSELYQPFPDSNTVYIGDVGEFTSDGDTAARYSRDGETIILEDLETNGTELEVINEDRHIGVDGVNRIEYGTFDARNTSTEIDAHLNSNASISIHDLDHSKSYALVDDAGQPYDVSDASGGSAEFDGLPSGETQMSLLETTETLEIRNETNPDEIIDDEEIEFQVRFFEQDGDSVFTRTAENGEVDMGGLPVDEEFLVEVRDENADYVARRVLIDSIFEQQEVYLLPSHTPSGEVQFNLQDDTGRFGSDESRLFVQKPIERNGSTSFQTVSGDFFGPGGSFTTVLEDEERYRLVIQNDEGEERALGDYRVQGAATEILPIGEVEFGADVDEGAAMRATLQDAAEEADHNHEVRVTYLDPEEATYSFDLTIETQDEELYNVENTGPYGIYQETVPLPVDFDPDEDNAEVIVEADRDGETVTFEEPIGDLPDVLDDPRINDRVLEIMGWVSLLALIGLLVIVSPPVAALVGTAYAGLLALTGIVPIPMTAVVASGCVSVVFVAGTRGGLR